MYTHPGRRKFLKSSLISGISLAFIPSLICREDKLDYSLELDVPTNFLMEKGAGVTQGLE